MAFERFYTIPPAMRQYSIGAKFVAGLPQIDAARKKTDLPAPLQCKKMFRATQKPPIVEHPQGPA